MYSISIINIILLRLIDLPQTVTNAAVLGTVVTFSDSANGNYNDAVLGTVVTFSDSANGTYNDAVLGTVPSQ